MTAHAYSENTKHKAALITGATAGIGLALTKLFARDGYDLVLVARNEEKLNVIANELTKEFGITVYPIAADLAKANAPDAIFQKTRSLGLTIDVLVNNAGSGSYGPFTDHDLEDELSIIALNITALIQLTHHYLQEMKTRGAGKILNVASTAAFQPGPLMAVYYATKAFVLSFSEALRNEAHGSNISVTALCPGATRTDFTKREPSLEHSRLFRIQKPASAGSVALAGYRGLLKNKAVVIPGFNNKALAFLVRFGPRNLVTNISRWMLEN
jgi:short-subunit dehydrogenase